MKIFAGLQAKFMTLITVAMVMMLAVVALIWQRQTTTQAEVLRLSQEGTRGLVFDRLRQRGEAQVAQAAGFAVATLYCNSQPMQFWASEMHKDGHALNAPEQARYKRMRRRFFRELADWVNETDQGDQIVLHLSVCGA